MPRLDIALMDAANQIDALFLDHPALSEDEELRADMIEGATTADEVLSRLAKIIREREAFAAAQRILSREYSEKARRNEDAAGKLRQLAGSLLDRAELRKWPSPHGTFSVTPGRPSVNVTDADALPDALTRITRSPDKAAILEALNAGTNVPGAELTNGSQIVRLT